MAARKRNLNEVFTGIMEDSDEAVPDLEAAEDGMDMRTSLSIIRKRRGVNGYIIKDAASATIDLQDSTKLVDYAMLSQQAFDTSMELQGLYHTGSVENVIVECADLKILCLATSKATACVFMEKTADHAKILKELAHQPR
ncbi:MAG: hypothetical protein ACE14S_08250 [Candidatus Bathyarchaeia archaeon]